MIICLTKGHARKRRKIKIIQIIAAVFVRIVGGTRVTLCNEGGASHAKCKPSSQLSSEMRPPRRRGGVMADDDDSASQEVYKEDNEVSHERHLNRVGCCVCDEG